MKKFSVLALSLLAAASITACNDSSSYRDNAYEWGISVDAGEYSSLAVEGLSSHKLAIMKDDSCKSYREHVLDVVARQIAEARFYYVYSDHYCEYEDYDWKVYADEAMPNAEQSGSNNGGSADSGSKPAGEFTVTNIQEEGVDEVDIVKNNGNYMYVIQDGVIHIIKAWPAAEMTELSKIELMRGDDQAQAWFYATGLLLSGDRLISLETGYKYFNEEFDYVNGYSYRYRDSRDVTAVRIFDVSDPAKPKQIKSHVVDGSYVDARMINNRLHLVSSTGNYYFNSLGYSLASKEIPGVPRFIEPWSYDDFECRYWSDEQWDKYEEAAAAWNEKRDENIEKYTPVIRAWLEKEFPNFDNIVWPQHSVDGGESSNAIGCGDLYVPGTTSKNMGYLLISELYGDDFENYHASALSDSGWLVYASKDNLYVTSTSYDWWYLDTSLSHIHHFSLGDSAGNVKYVNSAEVSGCVDNSFWMSEYDNHLRVVSSPTCWNNAPEGHNLSVFDIKTPSVMNLTGSVKGFGKDERVYASRMIGKKGYVVTYRNTDPFFTFDLSDPSDPKLVGSLKINGYSSYIHAIDENHLLTIGEDADENGSIIGMHLQVFDVTDLANPTRKYHANITDNRTSDYSYTSSWSEALNNHHAINYHNASGLLAIPVNIATWSYPSISGEYTYRDFSGMFIYRVKADSDFEFLGGVNHYDLINNHNSYHWWTQVDRARFYFEDAGVYDKNAYVYTISDVGIKASDANSPNTDISKVAF